MNLNLTTATRIGLNLLAVLGVVVLLKVGAPIFLPLIFSVLLASILYPFVRFLNVRIKLPWFFACLIVLITGVAMFLLVFIAFGLIILLGWIIQLFM